MPEPSTRPLDSLPLLVLTGIAEALCPHCTEDPSLQPWETPIHFGGGSALLSPTSALANLAATCQVLNSIVTPILYHHPQCGPGQHISLLRTLHRRPDLARRVKVLRLDYEGGRDIKDEHDRAFVLDLVARYGQPTITPQANADTEDGTLRRRAEDEKVDRDYPMNLLLAHCPNVEKFSTYVDYFWDFNLLRPASLPHLKDIYVAHGDTELGIHLEALRGLYLAAPHMETFTSFMAADAGPEPFPLAHLRHLRLEQSAISTGCLRALLSSCPQLESFFYEAGGGQVSPDQFSVTSLRKLLLRYVPRLKRLELDFEYDADMSDWEDQDDADDGLDPDPAPGFASLSYLEKLVIDPEILDKLGRNDPMATLFPQSLKTLLVTTHDIPSRIGGEDISAFTSSVVTLLPQLTTIKVRDYGKGRNEYVRIL